MKFNLKRAMLTGVSVAFLAVAGVALAPATAQAGIPGVTPKRDLAPASLTETVQYRRRARAGRVGIHRAGVRRAGVRRVGRAGVRRAVIRRGGVRYARGYYGPRHYAHRRYHAAPFFPAAVLGVFASALGSAIAGPTYYCDPAYYSWNRSRYCNYGYYPAAYPVYYGGYYPAYGAASYSYGPAYYPAYRSRRVVYRSRYQRPRTVRYRAVAPRRHFVGARTYVRSGYRVRRAR